MKSIRKVLSDFLKPVSDVAIWATDHPVTAFSVAVPVMFGGTVFSLWGTELMNKAITWAIENPLIAATYVAPAAVGVVASVVNIAVNIQSARAKNRREEAEHELRKQVISKHAAPKPKRILTKTGWVCTEVAGGQALVCIKATPQPSNTKGDPTSDKKPISAQETPGATTTQTKQPAKTLDKPKAANPPITPAAKKETQQAKPLKSLVPNQTSTPVTAQTATHKTAKPYKTPKPNSLGVAG